MNGIKKSLCIVILCVAQSKLFGLERDSNYAQSLAFIADCIHKKNNDQGAVYKKPQDFLLLLGKAVDYNRESLSDSIDDRVEVMCREWKNDLEKSLQARQLQKGKLTLSEKNRYQKIVSRGNRAKKDMPLCDEYEYIIKNITTAVDSRGNTVLMDAAWQGDVAAINFLLRHGADVDGASKHGVTPLMMAVCAQNIEVVKILLSHGASVHAMTQHKETPLWYAQQLCAVEIVEILKLAGATEQFSLFGWLGL